ncbi:MAG TPA: 6-phosphogluconolactonase [Actinomycetes bacterium]|nr:6-phosphogluconolactonase [Actinomycetes bacterium]
MSSHKYDLAPPGDALMRITRTEHELEAAVGAASCLANRLTELVDLQGQASVAFSGGKTPQVMFDELARMDVPWQAVHVFQVDERVAPDGDPDRNWTGLTQGLLEPAGIPRSHRHAIPVTSFTPEAAASEYGRTISMIAGQRIDVIHLGLGDDGHTASWPPGDAAVISAAADVASINSFRGFPRVTLTPRMVNRADAIVWLVTGTDKSAALSSLANHDGAVPAAAVRESDSDMFTSIPV